MRKLLLTLIFCAPVFAQSCPDGLTLVQGTVNAPGGATGVSRALSGTVTVSAPVAMAALDGTPFGKIPIVLNVAKGVVSICLEPNDTATPSNTTYAVVYDHHDALGSARWNETWYVSTASRVTIGAARINAPLPMVASVNPSQIGPPCPAGQVIGTPVGGVTTGCVDGTGITVPPSSGRYCWIAVDGVTGWAACSGSSFDSTTGLFDAAEGLFDSN